MINLRVTDIKQYFYCGRIIYYTYCLPVPRQVTMPMQVGSVEHEVVSVLERRRNLRNYGLAEGDRMFHVSLYAPSLGLTGMLDMLITSGEKAFPVEFKWTIQRLNINAKCQAVAYAMMVEECLGKSVECAFIYRPPRQNFSIVSISLVLRQKVLRALDEMRELVMQERMPKPPSQRGKCVECEFRRYCRDVI